MCPSARLSKLSITKFSFPQKYLCIMFHLPAFQFHKLESQDTTVTQPELEIRQEIVFSCGIFTTLRNKHAHRHPPSSTHTFIHVVTHTSVITLKYLFHVATKSNFQHAIPNLAECFIHPSPSRLLTLSTD